jgi:glycosyltransferase involved in cell wall biosynthesis
MSKKVSIVIPCLNEEKNIDRTFEALDKLKKEHKLDLEVIAVNDGSTDNTWEVIKEYSKTYSYIKGINLMTNYGQTAAYQAGFDSSTGDYVLVLSSDLEIPISNVLKVIEKLDEGYDFVNTHRVGRWGAEKAERQVKSNMANLIIAKVSGIHMMDRGSGLKGFKRVLIDNLKMYGEMHRFIPDYMSLYGAKMTEFEVEFKDRDYGVSNYMGHKRTVKVILDLLTLAFMLYFAKKPFWMMPGRIFGATGVIVSGLGSMGTLYLLVLKLLGYSIGNRPLLIISIFMIVLGVQSVMLGMIGELLVRVYFESTGRKIYTVRETV